MRMKVAGRSAGSVGPRSRSRPESPLDEAWIPLLGSHPRGREGLATCAAFGLDLYFAFGLSLAGPSGGRICQIVPETRWISSDHWSTTLHLTFEVGSARD